MAVLFAKGLVVILGVGNVVDELFHGFPVLIHQFLVAELFPDGPWDDDTGIRPSQTHHVVRRSTVLCHRGDSGESSDLALGIPHVTHPLVEEPVGIGEERTCLGENLRVGRPSKALVALRAIGRD